MTDRGTMREYGPDAALMVLIRAIASRDADEACRLLVESRELARQAVQTGASRQKSTDYFLRELMHYVYAGDTALHLAAAAHSVAISKKLIAAGANVGARNRRGAEPLHYAADGCPGSYAWNSSAQAAVIAYLIEAGADPNSVDKSGVAPLHRAVRTR